MKHPPALIHTHPLTYVHKRRRSSADLLRGVKEHYVAIESCTARRPKDLALRKGDVVEILDRDGRFVKGKCRSSVHGKGTRIGRYH